MANKYTWNASDPNAVGAILYAVVDGSGSATTLVQDYVAANPQPALVPGSVSGSSTAGNPVQIDPTLDADWPWPSIPQKMAGYNTNIAGVGAQPYAYWQTLGSGSSPLETWAQSGPGTSAGAAYTYVLICKPTLGTSGTLRCNDSNFAAPCTFYFPETGSANLGATTWKNIPNSAITPTWTYINKWLMIVVTIELGIGGVVYANFTSGGSQTPVSSGLNVLATNSTVDPNKTWTGAFDTLVFTASSNTSHTLTGFYIGEWVATMVYGRAFSAAQVNALALNPFSPLTITSSLMRRSIYGSAGRRGPMLRSIGL